MYAIPPNFNHADLEELEVYTPLLPESLQQHLNVKRDMIEQHPDWFARANQYHAEMVGLLALSPYTQIRRFLRCGEAGRPCGLVKMCDHCAFVRKMKLVRGFLTRFHMARFWFLTISFQGYISVLPGIDLALEDYWAAGVNALKQMCKDGIFKGVAWSQEMHLQSLAEPLVEPHVHAIVDADDISIGAIADLRERVMAYRPSLCAQFMAEHLPAQLTRPVTTRTYELKSQIDLANVLEYLVKTINLPQCYLAAWPQAEANNRAGVSLAQPGRGRHGARLRAEYGGSFLVRCF
jgi:hypothetical protein